MLLSILIPTYNEEKTILKLLQLINYQKKKINLVVALNDIKLLSIMDVFDSWVFFPKGLL
jgi:glycosyltransferase involved in cell wall biosynthesis